MMSLPSSVKRIVTRRGRLLFKKSRTKFVVVHVTADLSSFHVPASVSRSGISPVKQPWKDQAIS